ncbi:MAG: FkbM family methyltransferase [Alphaproteobacteria bacterium]|nr:FkbM family methyltransferase [Alphaproteobacteria bacterium]
MVPLATLLGTRIPLAVVDVGAASMGPGTDAYSALATDPDVSVVGFEPDAAACSARNASAPPQHRFHPFFVGDGTERTFHKCANPLTSSLYPPNARLLDLFQNLPIPLVGTERVQTRRLDDVAEIDGCDFLKVDVQGAELDVLRGARRLLARALVVHTEVEFVPMYEGQPLFGDVDVFLRGEGFMLHRFEGVFSRQLKPVVINGDPFAAGSQILYAEAAVYVRAIDRLAAVPNDALPRFARIMHDVYGSMDLAAHLLHALDARTGGDALKRYLDGLARPPA